MNGKHAPGLTATELRKRAQVYRASAALKCREADALQDQAEYLVDKAINFELIADAMERMAERGAV